MANESQDKFYLCTNFISAWKDGNFLRFTKAFHLSSMSQSDNCCEDYPPILLMQGTDSRHSLSSQF